jgi:hypothetical protein
MEVFHRRFLSVKNQFTLLFETLAKVNWLGAPQNLYDFPIAALVFHQQMRV